MRKSSSGPLLMLYLWLAWVPVIYDLGSGHPQDVSWNRALLWTAVYAFLVWRVWNGSWRSWAVLVLLSSFGVLVIFVAGVWPWDASVIWNLIPSAAQLAILLSGPVRGSVSRPARA